MRQEETDSIETIYDALSAVVKFRDERNWAQHHTPRHLTSALSIEAGELQETMLWKSDDEIASMVNSQDRIVEVEEEVGDVLIFYLLICDKTNINPIEAIKKKKLKRTVPSTLKRITLLENKIPPGDRREVFYS